MKDPAPKYGDLSLYRRLIREARPYWLHIGAIFLIGLLATPLALLAPLPLKITVDSVLGSDPLPGFVSAVVPAAVEGSPGALLALMAVLMVIIAIVSRLQWIVSWLFQTWVGERLVLEFRARVFRHLQRLSLAYHDSEGSSDSIYRVQYDATAIQNIAVHGVTPFITAAIQLVAMVYVTAMIDLELAVVALVIIPVIFVLTRVYRKRLRRQWKEVKHLESSAMSVVQESLSAVRVVKAFGQEDREGERYVRDASKSLIAQIKAVLSESSFSLLVGVTMAGGTAAVLYIGAKHVRDESLSLGDLLLVMGYLAQIYDPVKTIGRKIASLQKSLASAERVFAILDARPEVVERPDARKLDRAHGALSFENVTFAYEPGHPVVSGVSLEVPAGSRVGIAGTTGAGKTTLVSLLPRFYDPEEGRILLDGVDMKDYKLADLRNQYSIVMQETILFSTTIEENIAYGKPGATHEEIVEAAKAANAHDFVLGLPGGYETQVGERGMRLSGGERQRISVARAFLKDAPILLLDEPTSVDVKTEAAIMEALERLMEGRTTFIIAHRLSTLDGCEIRIEVENGRAVLEREKAHG